MEFGPQAKLTGPVAGQIPVRRQYFTILGVGFSRKFKLLIVDVFIRGFDIKVPYTAQEIEFVNIC